MFYLDFSKGIPSIGKRKELKLCQLTLGNS
jgi:hypothetical protein